MAQKKHNKKLPPDAVSEEDIEPLYGYVHGEWDAIGGHKMSYCNPNEHDKFYHEEVHSTCSYIATQYDDEDKEINTYLRVGEVRNYTGGGHSQHVDRGLDTNVEDVNRLEVGGDHGHAIGKDEYYGRKGMRTVVASESETYSIPGSSSANRHKSISGNHLEDVEGNKFDHAQGHTTMMNEKSHAHVVGEEWADFAGGNYDFYGEKKFHIFSKDNFIANTDAKMDFSSKQDLTIKSDSKITLEVGSSKITITSSKITIESSQVEIKGSGSVKINGSPVQVNDGTNVSTPFQVP